MTYVPDIDGCCFNGDIVDAPTATTSAPCVDLINQTTGKSDCPGLATYCTNPNYVTLMRTQCPKTCGLCSSTCADSINKTTGKSDCPGMATYCTNPTYVSLMKTQCPKTCGFC